MKRSANRPTSAKNVTGDFGHFTEFAKRLFAVPHSEIKAQLDAEKKRKAARRVKMLSASRRASSETD
jgi:hypothetical protein